jgi:hypothetical protein
MPWLDRHLDAAASVLVRHASLSQQLQDLAQREVEEIKQGEW